MTVNIDASYRHAGAEAS